MTTANSFVQLYCERARGRPKPACLTNRSECTCDAHLRIAYTSDAW